MIDPEKQKALDAVKDKDNNGYDVKGVRCRTAAEVHAAWKDDPVVADAQDAAPDPEKPAKKSDGK